MKITNIFLDMDGVLCNWVGGVCRLFGKNYEDLVAQWDRDTSTVHGFIGVSRNAMWQKVNAAGPAFWANLEPYPWVGSLWANCNRYAPTTICTTPGFSPGSASGKLMWLDQHLGDCRTPTRSFRDYIFTAHKGVVASPGKLLIDDRAIVCSEFEVGGGSTILFPNPLNRRCAQASEADHFALADLSYWMRHGKAPTE